MKQIRALTMIAALVLAGEASAQMGGGMPMGGASEGSSVTGYDPNVLSAGEKKKWAKCQAQPIEDMAKDTTCRRLEKKVARIAARGG